KSPSVFQGYYKNDEETKKTLKDGWLSSGDTGFIDEDGHLIVFDRSKDVMILNDDRPFAPQYLEARLKFSPYVQDAWVVGDKLPYVTAVMCIDYSVVGKWADENKLNYTSYPELSQDPKVYDLIQKQIEQANKDLPESAKIRKFVNLFKAFDADDDELTRTSKLRRGFMEDRYKGIIETLYKEKDNVQLDMTIAYEDGRTQRIKTDLRIQEIKE
nr:AMP-binding protein [Deltaproteobacteria bacterium]